MRLSYQESSLISKEFPARINHFQTSPCIKDVKVKVLFLEDFSGNFLKRKLCHHENVRGRNKLMQTDKTETCRISNEHNCKVEATACSHVGFKNGPHWTHSFTEPVWTLTTALRTEATDCEASRWETRWWTECTEQIQLSSDRHVEPGLQFNVSNARNNLEGAAARTIQAASHRWRQETNKWIGFEDAERVEDAETLLQISSGVELVQWSDSTWRRSRTLFTGLQGNPRWRRGPPRAFLYQKPSAQIDIWHNCLNLTFRRHGFF